MTSFWHPFANMAQVSKSVIDIERGEGVYVYDTAGKRYLDGTASLWYSNLGYGRNEIGAAMAAQSAQLANYHTFGDFTNPVVEQLCNRLAAIAPVPGSKVFLGSGGSDAVDTAAKLCRRYFSEIGPAGGAPCSSSASGRITAPHAYGTSLAGLAPNLEGHGPMIPDIVKVPHDDADALAGAIDGVGADRVAGFWCEPVVGAGGVPPGRAGDG